MLQYCREGWYDERGSIVDSTDEDAECARIRDRDACKGDTTVVAQEQRAVRDTKHVGRDSEQQRAVVQDARRCIGQEEVRAVEAELKGDFLLRFGVERRSVSRHVRSEARQYERPCVLKHLHGRLEHLEARRGIHGEHANQ